MKTTLLFVIFSFFFSQFYAQTITQEVVSSGGGNHVQNGISLQFNIGETLIETYHNSTSLLQQGFEQGEYSILNTESLENLFNLISIYPNPTKDFITIEIQGNDEYMCELTDFTGRLINKWNINSTTTISLNNYQSGVYTVKMLHLKSLQFKTYKITKYE